MGEGNRISKSAPPPMVDDVINNKSTVIMSVSTPITKPLSKDGGILNREAVKDLVSALACNSGLKNMEGGISSSSDMNKPITSGIVERQR